MKKSLIFAIILSGYIYLPTLVAQPQEKPIDLVAFWSGVANYYKNKPEFREHALSNLKRVTTLRENEGLYRKGTAAGGAGFMDILKKYTGGTEGLKEKTKKYFSEKEPLRATSKSKTSKAIESKEAKTKKKTKETKRKEKETKKK